MRKLLAVALCLLLSACSYIPSGTESLLRAPKLSKRQAAVYEALESTLPANNIVYKYIQRGEYRSPFVFYDMDGDGREEAIAFYSLSGDARSTRVKILMQRAENDWAPLHDFSVDSDQVDFVEFAHVLSREASAMLVGWQDTQRKAYRLGVYALQDRRFTPQALEPYQSYTVHDFDGDGLDEIALLQHRSGVFALSLLRAAQGHIIQAASLPLGSDVASLLAVTHGRLWNGDAALYIDEVLSDGVVATEVVRVAKGVLERLVGGDSPDGAQGASVPYEQYELTFRDDETPSGDVDGDGQVEIPLRVSQPGVFSAEEPMHDAYLTQYMHLTQEGFDIDFTAAVNTAAGYLLRYPERWLGTVAYRIQRETGEWRFYKIDSTTQEITLELLRVRVFTGAVQADLFAEGYHALGTRGARSYFAYIPETADEPLAVTENEVASMFVLV